MQKEAFLTNASCNDRAVRAGHALKGFILKLTSSIKNAVLGVSDFLFPAWRRVD
jgi:hypothetical protein